MSGEEEPEMPPCLGITGDSGEEQFVEPHDIEMLMSGDGAHPIVLICSCGAEFILSVKL